MINSAVLFILFWWGWSVYFFPFVRRVFFLPLIFARKNVFLHDNPSGRNHCVALLVCRGIDFVRYFLNFIEHFFD